VPVVSLLASATEIVCALGLRDDLAGRSHECDYPPEVLDLPQVSRPAFAIAGSSEAVDLAVKERLAKALSIYDVDGDLLRDLAPDVVVTQTQCEVCAVSPGDVERAVQDLTETGTVVVALEPNRLADIWEDIRRVARATAVEDRGEALVAELQGRLDDLAEWTAARGERPTVVTVEWIEPLMTAGNWMPELVEIAGGRSVLGEAGKHSPWMSWDELAQADPDVLLVSPCGFTVARTLEEMDVLARDGRWGGLKAVKAGRVFVADGNAYFHRPGPRVVESAELLAGILHGWPAGLEHEGTGWVRWG
jgi:iron complex transport system substrate-binding protein